MCLDTDSLVNEKAKPIGKILQIKGLQLKSLQQSIMIIKLGQDIKPINIVSMFCDDQIRLIKVEQIIFVDTSCLPATCVAIMN